jgi:hypothetical protein
MRAIYRGMIETWDTACAQAQDRPETLLMSKPV